MRRRRLRGLKCLLTANSSMKNQTPVAQGSKAHACAHSCCLQSPRSVAWWTPADASRPPSGDTLSQLRCHGVTSYNGGTTLLAKYCLPFLDVSLKSTFSTCSTSTLCSGPPSQPEMGVCCVCLRNLKEPEHQRPEQTEGRIGGGEDTDEILS